MIKQCFVKEYQGHRWLFKQHKYDDNYDMVDEQGEFSAIELEPHTAELLANQLNILQKYQTDDQQHLLLVNLILDFVKENKDVDKDIIIAVINNVDKLMVK